MERRTFLICLAPAVLLGAYLRLVDLAGPSLWLDEILHLHVTRALADDPWYRHLLGVHEIKGGTENGALYYRLQILGQRLAPGDLGVRLLPASIGILTLPLMALAGRRLGGYPLAFIGTFLLAVAPLHVYFSREGRPYYLLMAMALWLLALLLGGGSKGGALVAYLACPVTAYVGLHALPILLSFAALSALALGWDRWRRGLPWTASPYLHCLIAAGLSLALAYGLYMTQSDINKPGVDKGRRQVELEESPQFQSPVSRRSVDTFLASMTTSGDPAVLLVKRSWVLLALAGLGFLTLARRRPRQLMMTTGMFLLPAVLSVAALASVGRWYGMRYTSAALPAFLLLVAVGIFGCARWAVAGVEFLRRERWAEGPRNIATWSAVGGLLLTAVAPNVEAALKDPQRKADWRGVARFFDAMAIDGEPVVVPNAWPEVCLDYYMKERGRTVQFISAWESADLAQEAVDARPHGWLLTAGFHRKSDVRQWMHRFVPVLKKKEEDLALFFFPNFATLVETRFANGRGQVFEERFRAMGQRFDFDTGDSLLLGQGWSFPERSRQGTTFQWARGLQTALALPIASPRDAVLRFRARPFVYPQAPPQVVEVWLNDVQLAALELAESWNELQVEVPASAWGPAANILYLRFSRSDRPSEVLAGADDPRRLSAAFDYLELLPLEGEPQPETTDEQPVARVEPR